MVAPLLCHNRHHEVHEGAATVPTPFVSHRYGLAPGIDAVRPNAR
jgi:hypothetical protein